MKTSEKSISEVFKSIKDASLTGQLAIKGGVEKAVESINADMQTLMKEANYYKGEIIKLSNEWKEIVKEIEVLEGKRQKLRRKEQVIGEREEEVTRQEDGLVDLHQVLNNRKKILDTREKDLKTKERRARA